MFRRRPPSTSQRKRALRLCTLEGQWGLRTKAKGIPRTLFSFRRWRGRHAERSEAESRRPQKITKDAEISGANATRDLSCVVKRTLVVIHDCATFQGQLSPKNNSAGPSCSRDGTKVVARNPRLPTSRQSARN